MRYVDLCFRIRFEGAGRLPSYRGTSIRGAFGYALKKLVCIVAHRDCGRCLLRSRCAFPAVFEGRPPDDRRFMRKYPYVPQPFVLRVPMCEPEFVQPGDQASFGIRLFGPAIEFHPYVVYTVMRMGQSGLGRDRVRFEVAEVSDGEHSLLSGPDLLPPRSRPAFSDLPEHRRGPTRIAIMLDTPLRLQTNGGLNRSPSIPDLVRSAVRRIRVLSHFYGDRELLTEDLTALMASAETAEVLRRETRWHEIPRRSTRQGVDMSLSGAVGRLDVLLPDDRALPWLQAACVCHLGKATSFGYGRLAITVEEP